jgi:hypothetical protein
MRLPILSSSHARGANLLRLALCALSLTACGVASISPIVSSAEQEFDPALVGPWESPDDGSSAVITAENAPDYVVLVTDDDGKLAHFDARLGRLGAHRVLDLSPNPSAIGDQSAFYQSLMLPLHSFVVVDRVTASELRFRMVEPDSLDDLLRRNPGLVAHRPGQGEMGPVITAETPEVRRFFAELIRRPGFLGDTQRFVRRQ